jgi:O-antigen/teichoic acid export membrane protein
MSFAKQAAKSGLWLSGFRLLTQLFSWSITIVIARILVAEDYGLMAMASMLTGYI